MRRSKKPNKTADLNFDVSNENCNENHSSHLHLRSNMTGKEFTIPRSDVNKLVGNYISQSDVDPSLSDTPVLSRSKPNLISQIEDDLIAPAFLAKPKLKSVKTNTCTTFKCSFIAQPRPKVTWFHNNVELKNTDKRYCIALEQEMLSYKAFLKIQNCCFEDAGTYRIKLENKRGSTSADATLFVAEKEDISNLSEDGETSSCGTFCENANPLKSFLSENDLRQAIHATVAGKLRDPSECRSAPGSGTVTPRQPYSPRLYYKRRNEEDTPTSNTTSAHDVNHVIRCNSRASKLSDFDQSFSSVSSLSSLSNVSPIRLSRSLDIEDRNSRNNSMSCSFNNTDFLSRSPTSADSLSRSLTATDQRKLNCIKTAPSDGGVIVSLFKSKSNQALSDSESVTTRSFDEQSIGTFSEQLNCSSTTKSHNTDPQRRHFSNTVARAPPIIITSLPKIIFVSDGESLNLNCVVDGFPRPSVVWMKDAEVIDKDPDYVFNQTDLGEACSDQIGIKHTLTVLNASPLHSGTYTFTAFNRHGDASTEGKVEINLSEEP